jgi:hypothetical protein
MEPSGAKRTSAPAAIELLKFPYPYQAAVTVASDIDNASVNRFAAIHALVTGREVIRPGAPEWQTLGLAESSRWFDRSAGGVPGLGLDLADSFFLIADDVTMGLYRYDPAAGFGEDSSDGQSASEAIRGWIKAGQIDTYHGFLHYTRDQVLPLLEKFLEWCDRQGAPRPRVWMNHSLAVTPTGLCPSNLRPSRLATLARHTARTLVGPLFGRKRRSLREAGVWYEGATPGSPHYINDVLAAGGLRYVWLNIRDVLTNQIALPEQTCGGGRPSILDIVTMDDGVRYFHFPRCLGRSAGPATAGLCLRQSAETVDTSCLFTEANLEELCRRQGTCILFTHWTLKRSFPIQDEAVAHLDLVRRYRDAGRVWVAPLGRLLEWTRLRAFVQYNVRAAGDGLVVDIEGIQDPITGRQPLDESACMGLAFRLAQGTGEVAVTVAGRRLPASGVQRQGDVCWIGSKVEPAAR